MSNSNFSPRNKSVATVSTLPAHDADARMTVASSPHKSLNNQSTTKIAPTQNELSITENQLESTDNLNTNKVQDPEKLNQGKGHSDNNTNTGNNIQNSNAMYQYMSQTIANETYGNTQVNYIEPEEDHTSTLIINNSNIEVTKKKTDASMVSALDSEDELNIKNQIQAMRSKQLVNNINSKDRSAAGAGPGPGTSSTYYKASHPATRYQISGGERCLCFKTKVYKSKVPNTNSTNTTVNTYSTESDENLNNPPSAPLSRSGSKELVDPETLAKRDQAAMRQIEAGQERRMAARKIFGKRR